MATFLRTFEEVHIVNSTARQASRKGVESQVPSGFKQCSQRGNSSSPKSLGPEVKSKPRGCYGVWGRLFFPLIAERVPFSPTEMSRAQHRGYYVVKETVLDELKLSAG
ncbi:hypothetical protein HPB50_017317 [Hyalomma asiaticum]|uniref:Uncharacterized protein n=1 Tax=Hyalomma asiaticum TaxID=266040 RepID=A0ACB7THZ6_HYAAI|nr:hypothetical protein HPB50_017317 [Hyalomma asiaticum]